MKINGYGSIYDIFRAYNAQKRQQAARDSRSVADGEDTLVLSDQAKEIKDILAGLKDVKEVREEKVDRIKSQIKSGSYRVDALKVAGAMIEEIILDKQA